MLNTRQSRILFVVEFTFECSLSLKRPRTLRSFQFISLFYQLITTLDRRRSVGFSESKFINCFFKVEIRSNYSVSL